MIKITVHIEKFVAYVDLGLAETRRSNVTQSPKAVVDWESYSPARPKRLRLLPLIS